MEIVVCPVSDAQTDLCSNRTNSFCVMSVWKYRLHAISIFNYNFVQLPSSYKPFVENDVCHVSNTYADLCSNRTNSFCVMSVQNFCLYAVSVFNHNFVHLPSSYKPVVENVVDHVSIADTDFCLNRTNMFLCNISLGFQFACNFNFQLIYFVSLPYSYKPFVDNVVCHVSDGTHCFIFKSHQQFLCNVHVQNFCLYAISIFDYNLRSLTIFL